MMKLGKFHRAAMLLAGTLAAVAAIAQPTHAPRTRAARPAAAPAPARAPAPTPAAAPAPARAGAPDTPANPNLLGDTDNAVRKATAIVNGTVITGTDVDQRLALIVLANNGQIPPE